MTVEEFRTELEKIVSDLTSSGFSSINTEKVENLNKIAVSAAELGLKEGKHLLENLSGAMKAIQDGKSSAESGSLRLTALDFYAKKLSGSGNIEDL